MKITVTMFAMAMSGCSMFQGITAKSTEAECADILAKAAAEFCAAAAENRDKINAVSSAIKASK
jgi:hypothetical protein